MSAGDTATGADMLLAERRKAHLLLIDVQERLLPHVADPTGTLHGVSKLARTATALGVPITISEHCPEGLGATTPALRALAPTAHVLPKRSFSCWRSPNLRARIEELRREGRAELVVAGMEAHVCVCQTVLDLLAAGVDVLVVADAVSSRQPTSKALALARMERAGAVLVAQEMIAFEWLGSADAPELKTILGIVKS